MNFFLYFFSFFLLISSILVVFCQNSIRSILSLVLVFINVAALFIMIGAEFMSMILIIVYVGAVVILFLFIIMMIDINSLFRLQDLEFKDGLISVFLSVMLFSNLFVVFSIIDIGVIDINSVLLDVHTLSNILYSKYIIHFELFGLLLLLTMIAVVSLNIKDKSSSTMKLLVKKQSIYSQITRKGKAEMKKVVSRNGIDYE